MNITDLGWNNQFDQNFKQFAGDGRFPARVVRPDREIFHLSSAEGDMIGEVTGRFRRETEGTGDWPSVGDWVVVTRHDENSRAQIHSILQRQSAFSRKAASSGGMPESGGRTDEQVLAANIDIMFLVMALDPTDFSVRRLERYLTAAYDSGATPVVILNKADLCDDIDDALAQVSDVAFGVDTLVVSAIEGQGLEQLQDYIRPGQTLVLLGSSGVGKSTIINRLLGEERLATNEVRSFDNRGRHTTTHRELIVLPTGGILIDTPGIRELQLWSGQESLDRTFDDIAALAENCRFRDCHHAGEPGCAVEAAAADGTLPAERLESYHKLQREIKHLERRQSAKARHLEKLEGKRFAGVIKQVKRLKSGK